jgi:SPP1 family predicted phage head-tail adaptor
MNRTDFNKQIDVYSVAPVSDGFGGFTVESTLLDTRWAKLEPLTAGNAIQEYGLQDPSRTVRVTMRKNDLVLSPDYFIIYRSKTYKIVSGPIEIDFGNRFIEVVCQEVIGKNNVEPDPTASFYESGFYEAGFYEGATS